MKDFLTQFTQEAYPAIIAYVCIPFIVGILAIAFPILSEQRNKVNSKYSSKEIANLFKEECSYKIFTYSLIGALCALFIYVFQFPRIIETKVTIINTFLDYSAVSILLLTTIILIVSLFKIKNIIAIYESPLSLFDYCKKIYNKNKKEESLGAISHILYLLIKNKDEDTAHDVLSFLTSKLEENITVTAKNEIEIAPIYHEIIRKVDDIILKQPKQPYSLLSNTSMLDILIANGMNGYLSDRTYSAIWIELNKVIFYSRDEMFISYWTYAHQYMTCQFSDYRDDININEEEIQRHKDRFKEFHYMLGALLLYGKKYELLSQVMFFTQTMPAKYELVPNNMAGLIYDYRNIIDDWLEPFHYRQRYYFPNITGIHTNEILIMWLEKYFAILFLRQYNIYSTYKSIPYGIDETSLPYLDNITSTLELSRLKKQMTILQLYVSDYVTINSEIIESLHFFDFLNKITYKERKQIPPIELLNDYIEKIDKKIPEVEIQRKIDSEHITTFKASTLKILRNKIERITPLLLKNKIVEETNLPYKSSIGHTQSMLMDKGVWTKDVNHLNYDSILAERVVQEMEYLFTISFAMVKKSRIHKVSSLNIFEAIKKLDIEDKANYIIASVGFNIEYYMGLEQHKNEFMYIEKNIYEYIGVKLVDIGWIGFPLIDQSVFILRKEQLPELKKHPLSEEMKNKYGLEEIGDNSDYLYANVIDLHENTIIRNEIAEKYKGSDELEKLVSVYIGLDYELRWSKDANCIQIQVDNDADNLDEISALVKE